MLYISLASSAQYFLIDIDSLKSLTLEAPDTARIRIYRDIALGYMYQQGSPILCKYTLPSYLKVHKT